MNILSLPKYSYEGPSSRYRHYNYQSCFVENKIKLTIHPLFSKPYFLQKNRVLKLLVVIYSYLKRLFYVLSLLIYNPYKVIIIEYELLPFFPAMFEYLFFKRGIKYIVDYDDAIFHKYDLSKSIIIKTLFQNKIANVIKYANHVIVCNTYLEEYAVQYNPNITKIPTVVLLDRYKQKISTHHHKKNDVFIVGWIGSKTTSVYILDILPVMKKFAKNYPNVKYNLVGFDPTLLTDDECDSYQINIVNWSEDTEIDNILDFDVGIMPLTDTPWSKGKCGFKLIQYMTCQKPIIASPVGINTEIVVDGTNGYLASSQKEWYSALETLYLNEEKRKIMSKINYEKILDNFNIHLNCKKYIKLFNNL